MLKNIAILAFLVCITLFPALAGAVEAVETGRYFVHTNNGFLKTIFGVQHDFKDGFTTEAVYAKRSLLKFLASSWRIELTNVPKYQIAQSLLNDLTIPAVTVPERPTPSQQVPWGVAWFSTLAAKADLAKSDVQVALLDTGIDQEHPDLKGQANGCLSFTNGNTPWPDCSDSNGHGTHLAGIIAANGGVDNLGLYGLAPKTQLAVYKVCDATGACWADDIAAALRYAADQKVNIINLGLKGPADELVDAAITYAASRGSLMVGPATSGNELPGLNRAVLTANSVDLNGALADWTAPKAIASAPGKDIESTSLNGQYAIESGDSMAVAHITGLAARIWQGSAKTTLTTLLGLFK